jgi:ParB family chromosome partitioning protein
MNIPIHEITITGLNDRKVFDPVKLNELAESIKTHGILQNLTVRKNGKPNHYELAIGERRLKAATIAGLSEVPCIVKELSDTEFKEVMLIENVQREDIHPLDECDSFLRLSELLTEQQISLQVGKSLKYIHERLALNNLAPKSKELFRSGTMQLGHALILCVFKKEHQNKAILEVIQQEKGFQYFNHPQDLKDYMNQRILCGLSEAVFDVNDEQLVPKAGACNNCPKQSSANTELFACVTTEAKCMDQKCFINKTNVFVALQNKSLLAQFNLKKADCPLVSNSSYPYQGELSCNKWRAVSKADECQTVRVGFIKEHNWPEQAVMICTDKSCKVHFKNQDENKRVSEVPENEKPAETLSRRLENRRTKEQVQDYHAARRGFLDKAASVKNATNNEFELAYLIKIMAGRGSSRALEAAKASGFKTDLESSYMHDWIDEFLVHIEKQGKASMVTFLRTLILLENLCPDDKGIAHREAEDDNFLIHGTSLGIEFKPFLKDAFEARKEQHQQENAQVKDLAKKERERLKAISNLIKNAGEEYPLLHQAIKAKDKVTFLKTQSLEDLSKMAYRIGMKRKKDGTVEHYASEITDHLKAKLKELK